jgi:DMSO/TMAO reductase YedYZ molybdopterin-dependent catalytic subunit
VRAEAVTPDGHAAADMGASGGVPARDPVQACREALDAGLIVHRDHPLNGETELAALIGGAVMPSTRFYVRNHFHIPRVDATEWCLAVRGHVHRPLALSLRQLEGMRSQTLVATLECAGNGRSRFRPPTPGEQWRLGAVSTAEWTGVPLADVLDRCRPGARARAMVFRGADAGPLPDRPAPVRSERSLGLEEAVSSGALVAYAMNGEPLPVHHGYPLRLIVPGWYAMASVKWLAEIELIDRQFKGEFQTQAYVYEYPDGTREPVRRQKVKSLVTEPIDGEARGRGPVRIRGVAWSGEAPIQNVEVSLVGGAWTEASLVNEPSRHGWRWWELLTRVEHAGVTTVRERATDEAGNAQPDHAAWNRMGYGNNAIHETLVHVR